MTTQYFKVRNGLSVGEDAVTVDAATGNVVATGDVTLKDTVTIQGATSGSVAVSAPAVAGSQAYTLPTALPSVSGYVLASDTSGVMSWVANPDADTKYTIDASSTTGGANLNLVGSDATTDTVKFASGTGVTVAQTSASEMSIAIGQPVGTTDDVIFNTVDANLTGSNYILGQLIATPNTAYTPLPSALTTVSGANGFAIASSTGNNPNIVMRYTAGDTTAGTATAAALIQGGAGGTSTSPTNTTNNQVLGTTNFDGYTSGTSNNWASQIATMNQGAGTAAISPLQTQAYARQVFTNSTTTNTAVTGASGTGSVATLTFTLQNTAPYTVGQSVTIAGMTPSGYNGTYTITAATTSSISYANTTTGFTSGGTITAANTVTAAGVGFRIRGFANSTPLTVANRINYMDLNLTSATFKSNSYTFANEVITGATLTQTNYMTLTSAGHTIGNIDSPTVFLRTSGATVGTRPVVFVRNTVTATTTPAAGDGASYRLQIAGSNGTPYNLAEIAGSYSATGDTTVSFNIANGDQNTGVMTAVQPLASRLSGTTIRATTTPTATPGGNTLTDVAIFTPTNTTIKSNAVTLQTNAGVALVGSAISYNRVTGQWYNTSTITPAGANTAYAFAPGTSDTDITNIASVASTSQITPGASGKYNLQFSVQWNNGVNSEHSFYIWLRKNGTDVADSAGKVTCAKSASGIAAWNYLLNSANTTDYWELMYSVESTDITFPYVAASSPVPGVPSIITTLVPVGA